MVNLDFVPLTSTFFRKWIVIWLAFVCIPAIGQQRSDLVPRLKTRIDSLCQYHLDSFQYPGLAIGLSWSGGKNEATSTMFTRYGYADIAAQIPFDPQKHLFRIGSISKSITAAALARMSERGEIDLDAPISTWYPACPPDKADLTLRQIAGHLAGFRHYLGLEFFSQLHYDQVSDALEVFIHDSLLFEPGTQYGYSTYGWTMISAVMEKAVKKPFLQIIEEEVSQPLYLEHLHADHIDSAQFMRVKFYSRQDGQLIEGPMVDNSNKWAGGGFLCTTSDLIRFGQNLLERKKYLDAKTLTEFTTSQNTRDGELTGYGIGFRTKADEQGRSWFGHSGGSVGGTSMLLVYPEEELVIVTLVNLTSAEMDDLAWKIADLLREEKSR